MIRKNIKTNKKSMIFEIVELLVLIGFIIFAVFYKYHSIVLNLIYSSVIIRSIAVSFIPLCIINTINFCREDYEHSIIEAINEQLFTIFIGLVIGLSVASTFFFLTETQDKYNYIGDEFKSLFIYDNNKFDDIRNRSEYESEFELIENTIKKFIETAKKDRDISKDSGLTYVINYSLSSIKEYGYTIDNYVLDKYIAYVKIIDKKDKERQYYKIDYENNIIVESSKDEYNAAMTD